MKPVTYWTRGERNIGGVMPLIVLTNCDEIEFRYGDGPPRRASPDRETYPHLPHPPMVLDHRTFTRDELGGWGASWQGLTLTGYLAGEAVRTLRMVADPVPTRLEVAPDATTLLASEKDHVRVVVRALDQADQLLPFLLDPVAVTLAGPARLVGPDVLTLAGGTTGFWLESTGTPGPVALEVASPRFPPVTLTLESR